MLNPFPQARCLLCHEIILPAIGWGALFSREKEQPVCPSCLAKFEKITGERCRLCSRPLQQLAEQFRRGDLCNDCLCWEVDLEWGGFLDKNISIFHYNEFLKETIARFKFRGDYVIAKAFAEPIKMAFSQQQLPNLLVPIPLSDERFYERGFNQAEALLIESGLTPAHLLTRIHTEKQSKKSRTERIHVPQVFQISHDISLERQMVTLIDDIYTTGSTLRHAAKLLKGAGAERIESLTLAR